MGSEFLLLTFEHGEFVTLGLTCHIAAPNKLIDIKYYIDIKLPVTIFMVLNATDYRKLEIR